MKLNHPPLAKPPNRGPWAPTSSWSRIESKVPLGKWQLLMSDFLCFEKGYLFLVGGLSPKKIWKIWGQVKLDHFPQKKLGWKFSKIFEVSATERSFSRGKILEIRFDLRPMCTSSFSTINLDHLQERAAKFLKKNVRKSWSYYLCGPQKPSYVSRMK